MQFGNDAPDGQRFLILLNSSPDAVEFRLAEQPDGRWVQVFDTRVPEGLIRGAPEVLEASGTFPMEPRSLVLFQYAGPSGGS
jgi:glycogen operon protein